MQESQLEQETLSGAAVHASMATVGVIQHGGATVNVTWISSGLAPTIESSAIAVVRQLEEQNRILRAQKDNISGLFFIAIFMAIVLFAIWTKKS